MLAEMDEADWVEQIAYADRLSKSHNIALREQAYERLSRLRHLAASGLVTKKFNPAEPRVSGGEHGGEWSPSGGLKDLLRLAGKVDDLDPDERLVGSAKAVDGDGGTVRLALIDRNGAMLLRLGIGGAGFGARDDEAGPWRAGADRTAEINLERKKLRDEQDAIGAELDRLDADPHADPPRRAALQKRYDEIDEVDKDEIFPGGYTAALDRAAVERMKASLIEAVAAGAKAQAVVDAHWDEIDRLQAERDKVKYVGRKWTTEEEALWDSLTAQIEALKASPPEEDGGKWGDYFSVEGSVPGEWADIHYAVYLDDPAVGVQVKLGAVPHGTGMDFENLNDAEQVATLDPGEAKKLLRELDRYTG